MALIDISYVPGTQKAPQQTKLTQPAFVDTDHVHFPDGRLSTIAAYAEATVTADYVTFKGGCRAIHAAKLTGTHVGTYHLFGTHDRLYCLFQGTLYNITPLRTSASATLGTDPLALVSGDKTMTITYTAHSMAVGDRFKLSGATHGTGGFATANINVEHIVATVPSSDTITVELANAAPATDATEGGAAVQIFKQIAAGTLDQEAAEGYGVGEYGAGIYGQGGPSAGAQTFPRIWSFGNFGNEIVMCPGDYTSGDGQKIYIWDGDLTVAPTVLSGAPTDCNWVAVVNNAVVALCGRTVKISEIGNATVWSGLTYYSKTLERVWKLVAAYSIGEKAAVIFTPQEAVLLTYVGGTDLWDLADLYTTDGIIGPMAACNREGLLWWRGVRGFYSFDGGSPVVKEDNNQNGDWITESINYGKAWKSFCMADQLEAAQAWYFFPTGTDSEPGDYVIHHRDGHYTLGSMERTAAQRPGIIDSTFYMADSYSESVEGSIYRHFTLGAVTFNWYAETADSYYSGGNARFMVDQIVPDSNQSGTMSLTIKTKERPQGSQTSTSAYSITSTTEYVSVKAAGNLLAWRFSGSSAATLGAWKANVMKLGQTMGRR